MCLQSQTLRSCSNIGGLKNKSQLYTHNLLNKFDILAIPEHSSMCDHYNNYYYSVGGAGRYARSVCSDGCQSGRKNVAVLGGGHSRERAAKQGVVKYYSERRPR